jgi:excinuclease ABC subunit B
MGRAARNINGRAILYADRMTGSMERALDETRRRREHQEAHNRKHCIKPESIIKKVTDIMESAYPSPETEKRMVGDDNVPYDVLSPEQLLKKAAKLEKQMLKAARDLEFEEAARLRDEIHRIRDFSFGVTNKKTA